MKSARLPIRELDALQDIIVLCALSGDSAAQLLSSLQTLATQYIGWLESSYLETHFRFTHKMAGNDNINYYNEYAKTLHEVYRILQSEEGAPFSDINALLLAYHPANPSLISQTSQPELLKAENQVFQDTVSYYKDMNTMQ